MYSLLSIYKIQYFYDSLIEQDKSETEPPKTTVRKAAMNMRKSSSAIKSDTSGRSIIKKTIRICFAICLFASFQTFLFAQGSNKTDSLKTALSNTQNSKDSIPLLLGLSNALSGNEFEASRKFAFQAIENTNQCTEEQLEEGHNLIAFSYFDEKNYSKAAEEFLIAGEVALLRNNPKQQIKIEIWAVESYRRIDNVDKALDVAFRLLRLANEIEDHEEKGRLNSRIGELYREQDETKLAIKHLSNSYQNFENAQIERGMLSSKVNLALAYKQQDPEKALLLYLETLEQFKHLFNAWDSARIYSNLANINLDLNEYVKSESYLLQALACHKRIDKPISRAFCYKELAELKVRDNKPKKAIEYGRKAYTIAKSEKHNELLNQTSKQISDGYAMLKKFDSSYFYLSIHQQFKDSSLAKEKVAISKELSVKYAAEQQQQQIQLQDEQLARQEAEIDSARTFRFALFIGIALILIIAGILYYYSRIQVRKNKEIEAYADKLADLQATQSRWFTNIAHELRTPLTLILGPIQKLINQNKLPNNALEEVKMAQKYGDQLVNRVNEILEISRLESGKLSLKPQPSNINALIESVVSAHVTYAKDKGVELKFNLKNESVYLNVDAEKIKTIITNLVFNAVKFTPEGGTVKVGFIKASVNQEHYKIVVEDSGIGIPEVDISHVFDRFHQSSSSNQSQYGGSGVGLTLSQELAKLHGGEISVISTMDKGSCFTLVLPSTLEIESVSENESFEELSIESELESIIPIKTPSGNKPSILLVEDHSDMRKYIKSLLVDNYEVTEAFDGQQALDKLTDFKPDLIVSDVKMPGMDGLTFAKHVKEDEILRFIPFITLTAHANEKDRISALRTGVDDYLVKPFIETELLARVQNLISNAFERQKQLKEDNEDIEEKEPSYTEQQINKLEEIVRKNLSDSSFTVTELAKKAAVSSATLSRQIKGSTGLTSGQFIRDIRLQQAIQYLEAKQFATISEVVYEVGFENTSSFSRLFKSRYGRSPSDYLIS